MSAYLHLLCRISSNLYSRHRQADRHQPTKCASRKDQIGGNGWCHCCSCINDNDGNKNEKMHLNTSTMTHICGYWFLRAFHCYRDFPSHLEDIQTIKVPDNKTTNLCLLRENLTLQLLNMCFLELLRQHTMRFSRAFICLKQL